MNFDVVIIVTSAGKGGDYSIKIECEEEEPEEPESPPVGACPVQVCEEVSWYYFIEWLRSLR